MKWIESIFNHSLKTYLSGVIIGLSLLAIGVFKDYYMAYVTIRVYWLIVIAVAPTVLYYLVYLLISRMKRNYKTGDLVNVIADNQKFVVIRYHNWYPYYAVCKKPNSPEIICVHQKYLTRYEESEHSFAESLFPRLSTDIKVKTATISRL